MVKYTEEREFETGNDNVVFRKIMKLKDKKFVSTNRCIFDADTFLYCYVTTNIGWGAKDKKEIKYVVKVLLNQHPKRADIEGNCELEMVLDTEGEACTIINDIKTQLFKIMKEDA